MEQNLERMYQTWGNMIQGIRNINDMDLFQRFFDDSERFFDNEFDKKRQYLTAYKAQCDKNLMKLSCA